MHEDVHVTVDSTQSTLYNPQRYAVTVCEYFNTLHSLVTVINLQGCKERRV